MKKAIFLSGLLAVNFYFGGVEAHCQMPCGIYNDQMVYDKIDEYFMTMVKAVSALKDNKFENLHDRNQFVRWITEKDAQSDEVANVITTYFLQQKIRPGDEDNFDLVKSAHKLLFLLVAIKQNVDLKIVHEFGKEWDHFKELFHPEIECRKVMKSQQNVKGAPIKEEDAVKKDAVKEKEKNAPISYSEEAEKLRRAKLHRDHQHDYYHSLYDDHDHGHGHNAVDHNH